MPHHIRHATLGKLTQVATMSSTNRVRLRLEQLETREVPAGRLLDWVGGNMGDPNSYTEAKNWILDGTDEPPSTRPTSSDTIDFGNQTMVAYCDITGVNYCHQLQVETKASTNELRIEAGGVLQAGSGASYVKYISAAGGQAIELSFGPSGTRGGALSFNNDVATITGVIGGFNTANPDHPELDVNGVLGSVTVQGAGGTTPDPSLDCDVNTGWDPAAQIVDCMGSFDVGNTYSAVLQDTCGGAMWVTNGNSTNLSNISFVGTPNAANTIYCGLQATTGTLKANGGKIVVAGTAAYTGDITTSASVYVTNHGFFTLVAGNSFEVVANGVKIDSGTYEQDTSATANSTLTVDGFTADAADGVAGDVSVKFGGPGVAYVTLGSTSKFYVGAAILDIGILNSDYTHVSISTSGTGGQVELGASSVTFVNCNLGASGTNGSLQVTGTGVCKIDTGATLNAQGNGTAGQVPAQYEVVSATGSLNQEFSSITFTGLWPANSSHRKAGNNEQLYYN
jgi:hypothetical protein